MFIRNPLVLRGPTLVYGTCPTLVKKGRSDVQKRKTDPIEKKGKMGSDQGGGSKRRVYGGDDSPGEDGGVG